MHSSSDYPLFRYQTQPWVTNKAAVSRGTKQIKPQTSGLEDDRLNAYYVGQEDAGAGLGGW